MRVLDIDLDFFLEDCCPLAEVGERPALGGHEPWSEERTVCFLEKQCGLSTQNPVPGAVFATHDAVLSFWRARIGERSLQTPFHVTHVDAHSDLGIGYPGPSCVLNGVLPLLLEKRTDIERYYALNMLDEANYLLFALAFRYIASLDNVRNSRSRPDIPREIMENGQENRLRLRSFAAQLSEGKNGKEPLIPFHVYEDYRLFQNDTPYDFVTLACSARYAPKEADALIPLISRYIRKADA